MRRAASSSSTPALFAYRRPARKGEISFADVLEREGLPPWESEYQFCERRWRFDFAWPALRIALEVEGGTHGRLVVVDRGHELRKGVGVPLAPGTRLRLGGRHQTGAGFEGDVEKYNRAAILGWLVLRTTTPQIRTGYAITTLREAFAARGLE